MKLSHVVFETAAVLAAMTLAGWAALLVGGYPSDLSRAQARVAGAETRTTPCGLIEFKTIGEGPPVLVSHGAGGGFDQSLDFATPFASSGFRIIGVSRFGYLGTPLPQDASPERQADAYACLMDALEIDKVSIIGASAGAPSALQFSLRHPDRTERLILLVPALFSPKQASAPAMDMPRGVRAVAASLLRSDLLYWLASKVAPRLLIGTILATPPERFDEADLKEKIRVREMLVRILPVSARRLGLINDTNVLSRIDRYDLEQVTARTLIVSVEDDRYGTSATARYTAEHIRDAELHVYPSGGHVWIGHHSDVLNAIRVFLSAT